MAITFRHDAAAVGLPSVNNAGRKYGQDLVLQQQQQKYQAQQAGLNRLFDTQNQLRQNQFQNFRDMQQNNWQMARDNQQNTWRVDRDKMQFEQQQQQQRAQDFAAARDRLDNYAQDALNTPNLDPNIAKKIRDLRAGKMAILSGGFNPVEQQQFLDQYNAQLAAILSEIPPPAPQPTAQDDFNSGIVTDPETGMRYRRNAKGDFEPLPQQETKPKTAGEAFRADPKLRDKYVEDAIRILTNGNENPEAASDRRKVNAKAMELYDIDQSSFGGNPPMQLPSEKMGPALGTVDPATGQVIQTGTYEPAPQPATGGSPGGISMDFPLFGGDTAPQQPQPEIPISPPDPGQPPSPGRPTTEAPVLGNDRLSSAGMEVPPLGDNKLTPEEIADIENRRRQQQSPPKQTSKLDDALIKWAESRGWLDQQQPATGASPGRMPITANSTSRNPATSVVASVARADGRPTYLNPDGTTTLGPVPEPVDSRPIAAVDRADGRVTRINPDGTTSLGPARSGDQMGFPSKVISGEGENPRVVNLDFAKLQAGAQDEADRSVIKGLSGIYGQSSPEVQSAIAAIVTPGSDKKVIAMAIDYLQSMGIDIASMAEPPKKGRKKNRDWDTGRGM